MGFIGRREARPLFEEFVTDRQLAVETVLFFLGDGGIMKGNAALLSDTVAHLFHVELGNVSALPATGRMS